VSSAIHEIQNKDQAVAFASFLAAERNRHIDDIRKAERDLIILAEKWQIAIPWDNTHFITIAGNGHKKKTTTTA